MRGLGLSGDTISVTDFSFAVGGKMQNTANRVLLLPMSKLIYSKHRILRRGESIREDGLYQFKYHVNGKPKFVYSWRLEPTDKQPQGKKPGPSLRELEKQIGYDLDAQMDPTKKSMTVLELVGRYLATRTGVKPSTRANISLLGTT